MTNGEIIVTNQKVDFTIGDIVFKVPDTCSNCGYDTSILYGFTSATDEPVPIVKCFVCGADMELLELRRK